jgi:hypothetical protein
MGWNPAFDKAMGNAELADQGLPRGNGGTRWGRPPIGIGGGGVTIFGGGRDGGIILNLPFPRPEPEYREPYPQPNPRQPYPPQREHQPQQPPTINQNNYYNTPAPAPPAPAAPAAEPVPKPQSQSTDTPPKPVAEIDPKALQKQLAALPKEQILALQLNLDKLGLGASTDPEKYSKVDAIAGPKTTQAYMDYAAQKGLDPKDVNGVVTAMSQAARGTMSAAQKTNETEQKVASAVPNNADRSEAVARG